MAQPETLSDQPPAVTAEVQFHLALHVKNIEQSCAFYARLFDCQPAKQRADYAKFELNSPPLVLSLVPNFVSGVGALNHLGFRLPSVEALVEMQVRLETSGIASQREEGVSCCHSQQTKFWVADPDGNQWEFYVLTGPASEQDEDESPAQPAPAGRTAEGSASDDAASGNAASGDAPRPVAKSIWAHRLGEPLPHKIMALDASVDHAQLHGAFNAAAKPGEIEQLLAEVQRVLKPAGELFVHALVADRSGVESPPKLPGPASVVEVVPTIAEILNHLIQGDFQAIEFLKISEHEVFTRQEIPLREMKLRALRKVDLSATTDDSRPPLAVIYRGPFQLLTDDQGQTFQRGEMTCVSEAIWHQIVQAMAQDQFVLIANFCIDDCVCEPPPVG